MMPQDGRRAPSAMRFTAMRFTFGVLLLISPGALRVRSVAHVRRKAPVREKKAYDTSVRAFSPDGSIYQVEYAVQAADKGGLTIGVQTDKGLVLAAHGRRRSPLLKASSVSKIADVDDGRMCCAMSGLLPDGRLLLDYARTWVQEHRFEFDEAPSVEAVASQLSRLALKFNGYDKDGKAGNGGREEEDGGGPAMSRPVGVALLMAGVDRGDRPVLYHLDPSGAYVQWRARAIGDKGAAAEAKLEGVGPFEGMSVRRAMAAVLGVLREVLGDDEFSTDRLEMVCVDMMGGGRGSGDGGGGERGVCSPGAEHGTTSASDHDNVGGGGDDGAISGPPFAGEGSSVSAAPPSMSGGGVSDGSASGARSFVGRDSGSSGGGGVLEGGVEVGQEDGSSAASGVGRSSAAASFVPRCGYFRRVPKSEMDELLAGSTRGDGKESPTAANASADPAPVTDLTTTVAASSAGDGGLGLSYDEGLASVIVRLTEAAYCTPQLASWSCKACQHFPGMRNVTVINGEKRNVRGFVGVDIGDAEPSNRYTSTTRGPGPDDRRHLRAAEGDDRSAGGAARSGKARIVITFSGTDPSSVKNWIDDLEATTVPNTYGGLCEQCQVHRGFLAAYDLVKDQVRYAIGQHMQYNPHVQILITGHSLGAALAVLCFLDLRVNRGLGQGPNSSVSFAPIYLFGSPRVGNEAFATLTTRPGVSIFRLVHHRDPVPHLPLEAWGYHHPPTEVFYTEDQSSYQVCNNSGEDDKCSNQFWAIFGNIEDHLWYLVVNYSTAYMQCQLDGESRADREAAPALAPPAAVA